MVKKKPFSAKAKREQLRQKRLAASGASPPSPARQNAKSSQSTVLSQPTPPTATASTTAPQRLVRSRAPRGTHAHRFRLQLNENDPLSFKQSDSTHTAHSVIEPCPVVATSVEEIRPYPDERFSMPRRPPWRYDESPEQVDRRETMALRSWRERVLSGTDSPPYFENNLETWRQLWRVIERSHVFILVVDIRFPALHFVPDLYHYVTDSLGKGLVLALNKCDLVPKDVLTAWRQYFGNKYPKLAIAMFSSYPDAKLSPCEYNSDLLSKRERRMARSKLAAWGADELLAALNMLELSPEKKSFLEDWRSHLDLGTSDGDESQAAPSPLETEGGDGRCRPNDCSEDHNNICLKQRGSKKRQRSKCKNVKTLGAQIENEFQPGCDSSFGFDEFGGDNGITIGIVGHPNAGKSSLINGIFRKKVVSTSQTPGHTKHLQTIYVTKNVVLCDCPGLVFPGLAPRELQVLAGMFPVAQLREPLCVVKYLAERVDLVKALNLSVEVKKLEEYQLDSEYVKDGWTAWKVCEAWAMKRGYRTAKAARLDVPRAANHILRLAVEGRIVLSTVPHGFQRESLESDCGEKSVVESAGDGWSDEDESILPVEYRHGFENTNDVAEDDSSGFSSSNIEQSNEPESESSNNILGSDSELEADENGTTVEKCNENAFALLMEE